jgi:hypothetical protein
MRHLSLAMLLLAACRFDGGGIEAGGDDVPIDADPGAPDAETDGPPNDPPDASVDAEPDAMPDLDQDDDTILDAIDNCVAIPNPDQHNEDGDTPGDVCDNCPHLSNSTQDDTTEEAAGIEADGVGDACDPGPDSRETIALFDPFSGITVTPPPGWTAVGGTWTTSGDELHQTATTDGSSYLYRGGNDWDAMWIATHVDFDSVPGDDAGIAAEPRSAGPFVFFTPTGAIGTGFFCVVYDDVGTSTDTSLLTGRHAADGNSSNFAVSGALGTGDLAAGQSFVMRAEGGGGAMNCEVDSPTPRTLPRTDSTYTSGTVALATDTVGASFRYVVVFIPAT